MVFSPSHALTHTRTQGALPAPGVHHSYAAESHSLIAQGWEIEQKAASSPEQPLRRHLFSLLLLFNYSESINKAYLLKIAASFLKKNVKMDE